MQGTGRYITLAIFIVVMIIATYSSWKEDKEETRIVLIYLFLSVLGITLIAFIAQNW